MSSGKLPAGLCAVLVVVCIDYICIPSSQIISRSPVKILQPHKDTNRSPTPACNQLERRLQGKEPSASTTQDAEILSTQEDMFDPSNTTGANDLRDSVVFFLLCF